MNDAGKGASRTRQFLRRYLPELLLFVTLSITYSYFSQGAGPNQNSRFDLVRAVVEDRTFRIDRFARNTIDLAKRDDHFYSDKAPGLSFATIPAYAAYRAIAPATGPGSVARARYLMTTLVVGLFSALGAVVTWRVMGRFGLGRGSSLAAVTSFALGSPYFAYATLYVAHSFVAALVISAVYLLLRAQCSSDRSRAFALGIAGFAAGWAAISEYPIAVIAVVLGLYTWRSMNFKAMVVYGFGGIPPVLLLSFYNARCFGAPWKLGYSQLVVPEFQKVIARGFFGIGLPSFESIYGLLLSEFRGLLPLSPLVVFVPLGLWCFWKTREHRREFWLVTVIVFTLFWIVSSYVRWDGGAAMGPRYFIPALPLLYVFLAHGIEQALKVGGRALKLAAASLVSFGWVAGVFICLAAVSVMPEFPDAYLPIPLGDQPIPRITAPIRDFVLPWFLMGHLSAKATWPTGMMGLDHYEAGHEWDAWNLGERMGLNGLASLAPLLALWIVAFGFIAWMLRDIHRAKPEDESGLA